MLDFNQFIKICQTQLQPLLTIQSVTQLQDFNQKIKDFALSINLLFPAEWNHWKQAHHIHPYLPEFKRITSRLVKTIDAYEIQIAANQITIIMDNEKKNFPLLDPIAFIKDNLLDTFNIYFYILVGELLLEENFDYFQLYGVYLKLTVPGPLESDSDTEPTET